MAEPTYEHRIGFCKRCEKKFRYVFLGRRHKFCWPCKEKVRRSHMYAKYKLNPSKIKISQSEEPAFPMLSNRVFTEARVLRREGMSNTLSFYFANALCGY